MLHPFTSNGVWQNKLLATKNGIKHITTEPYHPSSNGPAEQAVQTFKTAMKTNVRMDQLTSTL